MLPLLLLSDLPVRIVSQPHRGATWTEVVGLIVTSLGVVVTVCAVLVALFGPDWHARRRAPRLTLKPDPPGVFVPAATFDNALTELSVRIFNEPGRDPGRDVEIFVSAAAREPNGFHVPAERGNLFYGRLDGRANTRIESIPPGFSRTLLLAVLGAPEIIQRTFQGLRPPAYSGPHSWATLVMEDMGSHGCWLDERLEYRVELVIVGSNFDAVTYQGAIAFADPIPEGLPANMQGYRTMTWTEVPLQKPHPAVTVTDIA